MAETIVQVDIATSRMPEMVKFYTEVFGIRFTEKSFGGHKHFSGTLGAIRFGLATSAAAGAAPNAEGVHQFHLRVDDLAAFKERALKNGIKCELLGNELFLRDPDGAPWLIGDQKTRE